ncbi:TRANSMEMBRANE PROTEIN [Salix viminalis]|uniref:TRANSMEMBRANE PROTEIN n=1 Tax=Salix viminalis TaxID=40686 RepID=A0A9Q0SG79_SALVM|nr:TRANSMEMBRANE PROTEIN [Salix viminalis]
MGWPEISWLFMLCWFLSFPCFRALGDDAEASVKILKAPRAFSKLNMATFEFQVLAGGNVNSCTNCSISCKLDSGPESDCGASKISYQGLQDGNHTFEVCINGSQRVGCATYTWTVDTIPPTAYITASKVFTNALNVSVNISFTEPCTGGGGFGCSSVNACNLLVYGAGQVIPSSFTVLEPNLKYTILVGLSPSVLYGRVILVMDRKFCTDTAGNRFTRAANSSFFVHFDRRTVFVDLRIHIPEKLLQLNNEIRTVTATNNDDNLKFYMYFSEPILNSSAEILNSLNTSQGVLLPISGESLGNRKFGFQVANLSSIAVVTIGFLSNSIISRPGTSVSPIAPVTFLYDSQRFAVRLSTSSNIRTKEHSIPISIKFMKPVFDFNSSFLSISGGHLQGFHEISRSKYIAEIKADDDVLTVSIPQDVTGDVAGNKNLASNILQVRHYSVPTISSVISAFATACFLATSLVAGLLTLSTASLLSAGAFSRPSPLLTAEPTRNLFRTAWHIQVFALSRWLAVTLPVEYYEFARDLQWSIPYFSLPWETGGIQPVIMKSNSSSGAHSYISNTHDISLSMQLEGKSVNKSSQVYGLPLSPMEYLSFFESHSFKPEAEHILDPRHSNGWRDFERTMFWLAVIGGGMILLHAILLFILKLRKGKNEMQKDYGALTLPRFEIFLTFLALPCICKASASLVRGGTTSGTIVGILLLGVVGFLLLALLLILSVGITFGKLLQYKEVHQEGQVFHWYQEIIRVTLGPGKRGQWTWKNQPKSVYLVSLGALFEDLRGPPKYMLSQIAGVPRMQGDRIIDSDDETEDAEAPFIQKLFGILRIYYTLLETVKRVFLGILAGVYLDSWSSKTPTVVLLSITSFQLFFLVLKKPFIKKKVQLVEIISISCQVGIFATCFILLEKELSTSEETKVGIFMIALFLIGFFAQMVNEWYALYRQVKRLDPSEKYFLTGLKIASIGFLMLFISKRMSQDLESKLPAKRRSDGETVGETGSSADRNNSSDKPWQKQLRELARASFTKERSGSRTDPSTSRTKWSGIWTNKRSGSSSQKTSSDSKSKTNQLYEDLAEIFASK